MILMSLKRGVFARAAIPRYEPSVIYCTGLVGAIFSTGLLIASLINRDTMILASHFTHDKILYVPLVATLVSNFGTSTILRYRRQPSYFVEDKEIIERFGRPVPGFRRK